MISCYSRFRRFQQKPFIHNQQLGIGVFHRGLLVVFHPPGHLQIQKEVRQPYIPRLEALLSRFHAQGTGNIDFASARSPGNEDVAVLCNISFPVRELFLD